MATGLLAPSHDGRRVVERLARDGAYGWQQEEDPRLLLVCLVRRLAAPALVGLLLEEWDAADVVEQQVDEDERDGREVAGTLERTLRVVAGESARAQDELTDPQRELAKVLPPRARDRTERSRVSAIECW